MPSNFITCSDGIVKHNANQRGKQPFVVACCLYIMTKLCNSDVREWSNVHPLAMPHFHSKFQGIWSCAATALADMRNLQAIRKNSNFTGVDLAPYMTMVQIVQTFDTEICSAWMLSRGPCNILPAYIPNNITPDEIENKKLVEAAVSVALKTKGQGNARPSTPAPSTAGCGANAGNSGGGGGNANNDQSKRRRTYSDADSDRRHPKAMGSFVAPPRTNVTAGLLFGNCGLNDQHCTYFHMLGRECTPGKDCAKIHELLARVKAGKRNKLLGMEPTSQVVYINPGLKPNPTFMASLTAKQLALFAPDDFVCPEISASVA